MKNLILFFVLINVWTFILYGWDKFAAIKGNNRIPEKVLHLWMFFGGSIGAVIGQKIFHHKTIKGSFQLVFMGLLMLQLGLVVFICLKWN